MKKKSNFLLHAIYLVIGGLCGIVMVTAYPAALELSGRDFIIHMGISLLLLFLAFFVQIIVHEAGHLVFGLLSGYKFVSFRVGSFMLVKEKGKLKVKIFSIMGTGGQCLMMPPPWSEKLPNKLYNFGGCIMNFVAAVLALGVFALIPKEGYFAVFLGMSFVTGLGTALINGIPMTANGIPNDGKNASTLSKDKEALRAFWLQLYVNGLLNQGERIGNLPKEWFPLPERSELKIPAKSTIGVFRFNYELDVKDFAAAEKTAEYLLSSPDLMMIHKNELLCELLFLKILRFAPKEEIEALVTPELLHYKKATASYLSRKRLDYAFALLHLKDITLARKALADFEKRGSLYGTAVEVEGEKELVEIIKSKGEIF